MFLVVFIIFSKNFSTIKNIFQSYEKFLKSFINYIRIFIKVSNIFPDFLKSLNFDYILLKCVLNSTRNFLNLNNVSLFIFWTLFKKILTFLKYFKILNFTNFCQIFKFSFIIRC